LKNWKDNLSIPGRLTIGGAPEGYDSLLLAQIAADVSSPTSHVLYVAPHDTAMKRVSDSLQFFAPDVNIVTIPAWDCLPYDRVSPNTEIVARRLDALTRLSSGRGEEASGFVALTTVNAMLQRVPPRSVLANAVLIVTEGGELPLKELLQFLNAHGYRHSGTVREPGEFAVRGGIVDVFPTGMESPLRLDFFGDELERIRAFDPMTQRTSGTHERIVLQTVSEVMLSPETITLFRDQYRSLFGTRASNDPLYEAISAGHSHGGMEHWLPLFHSGLETLFDYLPEAVMVLDPHAAHAVNARLEQIDEFYDARTTMSTTPHKSDTDTPPYRPIEPRTLFLDGDEWSRRLALHPVAVFSRFAAPDGSSMVNAGGLRSLDFSQARTQSEKSPAGLFDAVRDRLAAEDKRSVLIAAHSTGSRDRLAVLLREHGVSTQSTVENWGEFLAQPVGSTTLATLDIEHGFTTEHHVVLSEQDILGDRLVRPTRQRRRGSEFIAEVSSLGVGDIVVHVEHGIGRYDGLETLKISAAPHDCLRVIYAGDDKLFVPVENIEMLSRYGSDEAGVQFDRLGGAGWQARKARVKSRIKDIADQLLKIAAERALHKGEVMLPPEGIFDEFCARFQWSETEDQLASIDDVVADLASGHPMDRLICGDVGFGKTEIALRAAFLASMAGYTVAVVVPTTLLARQHFATFNERFAGLPVVIAQLSRLVSTSDADAAKDGLDNGTVDIVIGTQALLSKSLRIAKLGLLIIDEEQHFGVAQKEQLKRLKAHVHVLTLTATPIPRTLQMALSGVREMSIIATPPVDRLAVRTFVLPYDPVVIREAILREQFRGGQTFYVCPRISDISRVHDRLKVLVPEIKIAVAHGRMTADTLERVMEQFCGRQIDLLLCTNIIESGLDIPDANTIIIHRADMFGLSQLYQLRGRVGRAKVRAYAYLTIPPGVALTEAATRRLSVMQTLDSLGAGFTLASHDLDIRGAGNLLGEEQSGHIKEIGVELYQHMLEEAVSSARGGDTATADEDSWTPQITIGTSVLIPDDYVADLTVRLGLYRRASLLADRSEIDAFAAELIDRFGSLPDEVENLLQVIAIKQLCHRAGVEKIEAGAEGAVVSFRGNQFANPEGLVRFIQVHSASIKIRPEQKLVYMRSWHGVDERVNGVRRFIGQLVELVDDADIKASEVERAELS
jgi:transcription-repair coupling factor (superfamily II helicase)